MISTKKRWNEDGCWRHQAITSFKNGMHTCVRFFGFVSLYTFAASLTHTSTTLYLSLLPNNLAKVLRIISCPKMKF